MVQVEGTLAITASPMEGIYTYFRVAIVGGAVLASPVVAHQVWLFVAPGLYQTERKVVLPLALVSAFLFLLGAAFAYAIILPVALPFFLQILPAEAILSIDGYLRAGTPIFSRYRFRPLSNFRGVAFQVQLPRK